jgi:hypothetical protein
MPPIVLGIEMRLVGLTGIHQGNQGMRQRYHDRGKFQAVRRLWHGRAIQIQFVARGWHDL